MIIYNNFLVYLLSGFQSWVSGITIFPFIFLRNEMKGNINTIKHENIHLRQQAECLIIFFYIIYFINYLINRFKKNSHIEAYKNILFEKEAYDNENNLNYFKFYGWLRYGK